MKRSWMMSLVFCTALIMSACTHGGKKGHDCGCSSKDKAHKEAHQEGHDHHHKHHHADKKDCDCKEVCESCEKDCEECA